MVQAPSMHRPLAPVWNPEWSRIKRMATTHYILTSYPFLAGKSTHWVRTFVLEDLSMTFVQGSINSILRFIPSVYDADPARMERLKRFNRRMASKSYHMEMFPAGFPARHVQAASALVTSIEHMMDLIKTAEDVDAVLPEFCRTFLLAVEMHIRVFGENKPRTLADMHEDILARFDMLTCTKARAQEPTPFIDLSLSIIAMQITINGLQAQADAIAARIAAGGV